MSQTISISLPAEEMQGLSSASEPGPSRAPLEEVDLNADSRQSSATVDGEAEANNNESEDEEDEEAAEDDLYVEKGPVRASKVTKENGGVKRKRKRKAAGTDTRLQRATLAATRELSQTIKGIYDDLNRIRFGPHRPAAKSIAAILTTRLPQYAYHSCVQLVREWTSATGRFEGNLPGDQIVKFTWGEARPLAVDAVDMAKLERIHPTRTPREHTKSPTPPSPSPEHRSPSVPAPDNRPFTLRPRMSARSSVQAETREVTTEDVKPDISSYVTAQPEPVIRLTRTLPPGPAVVDKVPTAKEVIAILAAYAEVWDSWSVPEVVDLLVTETQYTDKTFWGRQVFDYRKRRGAFASVPPSASARPLNPSAPSASRAEAGGNASRSSRRPRRDVASIASTSARSKVTKNRDGIIVYELLSDDEDL